MTQFQILMIGLGLVLAASAFWDKIVSLIPKVTKVDNNKTPKVIIPEKKNPCNCDDECITDLTQIVSYWENLKAHCEENDLMEAANELEKMFPLLVKVKKSTPAKGGKS